MTPRGVLVIIDICGIYNHIENTMKNKRNYYRLLQVQPDAPYEIIRASYRTLMKELKCHPDLGEENNNAYLINEAYETLSDKVKRVEYDEKHKIMPIESFSQHRDTSKSKSNEKLLRRNCNRSYESFSRHRDTLKSKSNEKPLRRNCNRSYNRIEKKEILLYSFSGLRAERKAQLLDISPKGIRFSCPEELKQGTTIRLKSPLLKADVKIVNSYKTLLNEKIYYSVGAKFLEVTFSSNKGSFYSTSV